MPPDPDDLRRRLARVAADARPGLLVRGSWAVPGVTAAPVPAAVLVGIAGGAEPSVLLTKRNDRLKHHAGQVSFPGGRIDPTDQDATAAALREAREEVGLHPDAVETLGPLEDFLTGTGFRITPILGLVAPGARYVPAPEEVEDVFHYPLSILLDPAAPRHERQERDGVLRDVWVWPHPSYRIWGATAAILVHLAERLRAA
ncbi:MAG: CoA pyrophosphatase [Rhodospirillales bacterium]|nr:CoA pyrophosphatase [Rhodospirillales bacterium]